MEILSVERADHHGIVAGVIHDLGIIELINDRLGIDSDEKVSAGEAVAAMIINGLGFTDRPLSLTPQFFVNCPMDLLIQAFPTIICNNILCPLGILVVHSQPCGPVKHILICAIRVLLL